MDKETTRISGSQEVISKTTYTIGISLTKGPHRPKLRVDRTEGVLGSSHWR